MKAITIWQPSASAIAEGDKRNETRGWPAVSNGTAYKGWLAITAAKKQGDVCAVAYIKYKLGLPIDSDPPAERMAEITAAFKEYYALPFGKIVAVGWLEHCVPADRIAVTEAERRLGDYSPGRYAWMFSEVWRINEPWPVIGGQKIFDLEMPPCWQDRATKVF